MNWIFYFREKKKKNEKTDENENCECSVNVITNEIRFIDQTHQVDPKWSLKILFNTNCFHLLISIDIYTNSPKVILHALDHNTFKNGKNFKNKIIKKKTVFFIDWLSHWSQSPNNKFHSFLSFYKCRVKAMWGYGKHLSLSSLVVTTIDSRPYNVQTIEFSLCLSFGFRKVKEKLRNDDSECNELMTRCTLYIRCPFTGKLPFDQAIDWTLSIFVYILVCYNFISSILCAAFV